MNMQYLNSLPEVANKYKVDVAPDEKVVFTAKMPNFGTEAYLTLGQDVKFTMTNKRMIFNNGPGVWTIDIADDIKSIEKKEKDGKDVSFLQRKSAHFIVLINSEIVFDNSQRTLTGFVLGFKKKDDEAFGNIVKNLL